MTKPDQVCAVKHDDRKNAKSDIWGFQQDFRFEFGHDFANSPYLKKKIFLKRATQNDIQKLTLI